MEIINLISAFDTLYPKYIEKKLSQKRFKHRDIVALINEHSENSFFQIDEIGESVENRKIFKIAIGKGNKNILIWSQMHGNEPTGTMAIFDLLNFFTENEQQDYVKKWLSEYQLHIIPMLNPDGAELYQRRNALNIDINRDAKALQTHEGRLITEWREKLLPLWAFNLHDQDTHYSAGYSDKPACISLLAPAYNRAEDIDDGRRNAMLLLGSAAKLISSFIPGMIARYWSSYSACSFGDHFQSLGTNTLLIESGTYPFEQNKETPRKMNFLFLLGSFELLTTKLHQTESLESYSEIPENRKNFYDLIIDNTRIKVKNQIISCDIAINRDEINIQEATDFKVLGEIVDIGDLSNEFAYARYNAEGMEALPGLMLPEVYDNAEVDIPNFMLSNFRKGYLFLPLKDFNKNEKYSKTQFRVVPDDFIPPSVIRPKITANFYMQKDGRTKAVVVKGELMELN